MYGVQLRKTLVYFLSFNKENVSHFEEFIKSFLKNIILKKIKKYYNNKNFENCEAKYKKLLVFIKKYSIENPNSLEDNINNELELGTFELVDEIFSNKSKEVNVNLTINNNIVNNNNININNILPTKNPLQIKLPFKVTNMKDVNIDNMI